MERIKFEDISHGDMIIVKYKSKGLYKEIHGVAHHKERIPGKPREIVWVVEEGTPFIWDRDDREIYRYGVDKRFNGPVE